MDEMRELLELPNEDEPSSRLYVETDGQTIHVSVVGWQGDSDVIPLTDDQVRRLRDVLTAHLED